MPKDALSLPQVLLLNYDTTGSDCLFQVPCLESESPLDIIESIGLGDYFFEYRVILRRRIWFQLEGEIVVL